jgi:hypothetical protein
MAKIGRNCEDILLQNFRTGTADSDLTIKLYIFSSIFFSIVPELNNRVTLRLLGWFLVISVDYLVPF